MFRSSTGAFFASCSHDRTARLWSPDRLYPIRTFIGHTMDVDVSHLWALSYVKSCYNVVDIVQDFVMLMGP